MSRTRELIRNTGIIAIGKFSTRVISFFLLPLYTSILSASEYGEFDFLVIVASFLIPLITLLMNEGMFRFLIDATNDRQKRKVISQAAIYVTLSAFTSSTIIYIFLRFVRYKYAGYLAIYTVSVIMFDLALSLARGLGRISLYSGASFLRSLTHIISNIVLIVCLGLGVKGLLLSNIISCALVSIFVFARVNVYRFVSLRDYDPGLMREMLRYTFPLVPNNISWTVINFSDRLIITYFLGTAANGIYSVANKFPSLIDTIYGFFYISWTESAAKAVGEADSQQFFELVYVTLNRFLASLTIGLIASLPFLFDKFVNENYGEAYEYIPFLLLSMYFANMSGYFGGIFTAYKNTKILGMTTLLSAIINFAVCILLIKPLGLYAGVLSTVLANGTVYFLRKSRTKEYIRLPKDRGWLVLTIIVFFITVYGYYFGSTMFKICSLLLAVVYSSVVNRDILKKAFHEIRGNVRMRDV